MKCLAISMGIVCLVIAGCIPKEKGESKIPDYSYVVAEDQIAAGRYLVTVGGCNDCHTADFLQKGMDIPEGDWLTGSPVGWYGPWGTTYAPNLRLRVHELDEDQWVKLLQNGSGLPPMPWENVNKISEPDARAMYAYIKSLGNKGERMPLPLKPNIEPQTPYLSMFPQNLPSGIQE